MVKMLTSWGGCHPVFVSPFGGNAKTDTYKNLQKHVLTYKNCEECFFNPKNY